VPNKFHQIKTIPLNLVDLIKTSAMKTLWEKTLASREKSADSRLPTWCKIIQKTGTFLLQSLVISTPFFPITIHWWALRVGVESSESGESQQLLVSRGQQEVWSAGRPDLIRR